MFCKICQTRRPRRFCPAVDGQICSLCCGREREVTLNCPLDCEYLREARKHENPVPANPDEFPNQDIRVNETFIHNNEELFLALGRTLMTAALEIPGAVDNDVREALAALIRTHRSLQSGLIFETRPAAAELCRRMQAAEAGFRRAETERLQSTKTRDLDVLGVLTFFQRLELVRNNGRARGRRFIDFLRGQLHVPSALATP